MHLFYFLSALSFLLPACTKSEVKTINISGSSTVAPLVVELAKVYESTHPHIRINVQTGGSSRGISDAIKGLSDIGMVSRHLKGTEQNLKPITIARDGIGIICNKDVQIQDLSSQQLKDIFTGKITNWRELTQQDLAVTVIHKAQGRSTSELFIEHLSLKYPEVKAQIIIGDNEQGIKNAAHIPGSIGYVSIGAAEHAIKSGVPIKLVRLDGQEASSNAVAQGNFPILRPLNLVLHGEPSPEVQAFVEFAQSQVIADIVRKLDFVPKNF